MALHLRGNARCELGDIRRGRRPARGARARPGIGRRAAHRDLVLLPVERVGAARGGPVARAGDEREAVELCERRGCEHQSMWSHGPSGCGCCSTQGGGTRSLDVADDLDSWSMAHGEVQVATVAASFLARVLAHRGDVAAERSTIDADCCPWREEIEDLQVVGARAVRRGPRAEGFRRSRVRRSRLLRRYHEITVEGPLRVSRDPPPGGGAVGAPACRSGGGAPARRTIETPRTQDEQGARGGESQARRGSEGTLDEAAGGVGRNRGRMGGARTMPFETGTRAWPASRDAGGASKSGSRCSCPDRGGRSLVHDLGGANGSPTRRRAALQRAQLVEVAGIEPACSSD